MFVANQDPGNIDVLVIYIFFITASLEVLSTPISRFERKRKETQVHHQCPVNRSQSRSCKKIE